MKYVVSLVVGAGCVFAIAFAMFFVESRMPEFLAAFAILFALVLGPAWAIAHSLLFDDSDSELKKKYRNTPPT